MKIDWNIVQQNISDLVAKKLNIRPSDEQFAILKTLLIDKKNVIVNAVAGAGKTTVILELAACLNPASKILHITYNKELREENKAKVLKTHLSDVVSSYTIHGFANYLAKLNNFDKNINNDSNLYAFSQTDFQVPLRFDYLVIDEIQDANAYVMYFLYRLYTRLTKKPIILVLGDNKQMLYKVLGSSSSYLTHFDKYLNIEAEKLTLTTSFRVPSKICAVLNDAFIKEDLLTGFNEGGKVILNEIPASSRQRVAYIAKYIIAFIRSKMQNDATLTYEDFFILTFSVKNNVIQEIEHALVKEQIPVYFPIKDQKAMGVELDNKVVFTSINQAKGRERKFVFLLYFDTEHYAKWLNSEQEASEYSHTIPNLHYVALTRASQELIIFSLTNVVKHTYSVNNANLDHISNLLPYTDFDALSKHYNLANLESNNITNFIHSNYPLYEFKSKTLLKTANFSVDSLLKFMNTNFLHEQYNSLNDLIKIIHLTNYNLMIANEIYNANTNQGYSGAIVLINGLYLVLDYLYHTFANNFTNILTNYLTRIYKDASFELLNNYWQLLNLDDLKQYSHAQWMKWWSDSDISSKLLLISIILAFNLNIYSILQLPHFNWIPNDLDLSDLAKIFASFKIQNIVYQAKWEFKMTSLNNSESNSVKVLLNNYEFYFHLNTPYKWNEISDFTLTNSISLTSGNKLIYLLEDHNEISLETTLNHVFSVYWMNQIAKINIEALDYLAYDYINDSTSKMEEKLAQFKQDAHNQKIPIGLYKTYYANLHELYLFKVHFYYHDLKNYEKLNEFARSEIEKRMFVAWQKEVATINSILEISTKNYLLNYQTGEIVVLTYDEAIYKQIVQNIINQKLQNSDDEDSFSKKHAEFLKMIHS